MLSQTEIGSKLKINEIDVGPKSVDALNQL